MKKLIGIAVGFFAVGFLSCYALLGSELLNGKRSVGTKPISANASVKAIPSRANSTESKIDSVGSEALMAEEQSTIVVNMVDPPVKQVQAPAADTIKLQQPSKNQTPLDQASIKEIELVHLKGVPSPGEYSNDPPAEDMAFHQQLAKFEETQGVNVEGAERVSEGIADMSALDRLHGEIEASPPVEELGHEAEE